MNYGTRRAYDDHSCRCEPSRPGMPVSGIYELAVAPSSRDNPLLTHGKSTYVNHGCAGVACVEAQRAADRRRHQ